MRKERQKFEAEERARRQKQSEMDQQLEYEDRMEVQRFIAKEKQARRQSMANRWKGHSKYRKKLKEDRTLQDIQEAEEAELEHQAWQDVKRYQNSEKERRRQSLANFLKQEFQYRNRLEDLSEEKVEEEMESRQLDREAYNDTKQYLVRMKERRRLSIAMNLQRLSENDIKEMHELELQREEEEENFEIAKAAREDVMREVEAEEEAERQERQEELEKELQAAKTLKREAQERLRRAEELQLRDIELYDLEVNGPRPARTIDRLSPKSERCEYESEDESEDVCNNEEEDKASGDSGETVLNTVTEGVQVEVRTVPPPPASPLPPPPPISPFHYGQRPEKLGCCIVM